MTSLELRKIYIQLKISHSLDKEKFKTDDLDFIYRYACLL